MSKRILVVEDEEHIADGLAMNLEAEGYEVAIAGDGNSALGHYHNGFFDLIILDIMIPGKDGLTVCREIRQSGGRLPILFLTARDRQSDRIEGFLTGGDDYMTKPFDLQELLLRVAAIFRRQVWYGTIEREQSRYQWGDNWIDFKTYLAHGPGGDVELSQKECMTMKFLVEHANEVVSRDMILDAVWGYHVFPSSRTIDNFILRLRKIFEPDQTNPRFIHTLRGAGYKFTPSGETDA
ncbi:MAG: response regulator transcription factor [candidate division Zixibacteria bacterium]|nr:response regulator transcription factor [candidate division Zixibacteria bacterium]